MDLKKIDLNKLQDYAFTANEIVMSPLSSWDNKFINIKCLDNDSIIPTVKAIPLDKVKQAREDIRDLDGQYVIGDYVIFGDNCPKYVQESKVLAILDKLIAESEG